MRFIIVGAGRVGSGLARTLALRGHDVTVIDKDPAVLEQLQPGFEGKTMFGIGFDRDVLLEAGIQRADGLAAVTSSDEANVVAARIARHMFRVPRVIACLSDPKKAEIFKRMGLITVAPVTWGINRIADAMLFSTLETVYSLGTGNVDLITADVTPLLVGKSVNDLTILGEISVVAVSRGGETFLPTRGTVLQDGDILQMVVLATAADRLRSLLGA